MELTLRLNLPHDAVSIPIVRRVLSRAMDVLGVEADDRADIELAVTEACTNVLDHAQGQQIYEVTCGIDDDHCWIRVVDSGGGFDPAAVGTATAADESGRGILLMQALVDRVRFEPRPHDGTVVSMEKRLRFAAGSPAEQLGEFLDSGR